MRRTRGTCRVWASATTLLVGVALLGAPVAHASGPAVVPRPLCCIPTGDIQAIAIAGNTAYVGGHFHHMGIPTSRLAVLDATSGQPQSGWPSVAGGYVHASVADGSGGWYIGGTFTSVGGEPRQHLAHLRPDHTLDPAWTPSVTGFEVAALARFGDVVYAGGSFTAVNGTARANFAALSAGTGELTSLQVDTNGMVRALATSSRPELIVNPGDPGVVNRLYIGGDFTSPRAHLAMVDLLTGTLLSTDPKLDGSVYSLTVGAPDGMFFNDPATIYAGGDFTHIEVGTNNLLRGHGAAWNDTFARLDWDPGADSRISAMAASTSRVYLAGGFGVLHSDVRTRLGAVNRSTGATVSTWAPTIAYNFPSSLNVASLVLLGSNVYIGGRFDHANSTDRRNLAAFTASDGTLTSWDPDAPGFNAAIQHLGSDGTSLITSGEFETIGGIERHNLAAIDLATGQVTPFNPDVDNTVETLAVQGGTLYAGGQFQHVNGGTARNFAAAFDAATGQATGFDPNVGGEILAIQPYGGTVFLGGSFIKLNGNTVNRVGLAEVDAQTGAATAFQQDLDGGTFALGMRDDLLYVAGQYSQIGSGAREGLAAVKIIPGTQGALTTFDAHLDMGGFADARGMLVRGTMLYVGGTFSTIFNVPRSGFGAIDLSTTKLHDFDPHADFYPTELAADEQSLFVAGQFHLMGGAPRNGLAALDPQTGNASDWAPELPQDSSIGALGTSPEAGVLVGGIAGIPSNHAQGLLLSFALQPSTPAAPQATAGAGEATVSFAAPPDGGSQITQYRVTASPGGQTATGSSSPITITGLTPGTSYTFTVSAANAAGESPQSPPSNAVTPTTPAGVPTPPGAGGSPSPLIASKFRVTNKRFKVAKGRTALSARTKKGTAFLFRLSAAATSRITIARKLPGRRKGKRCVAPRKSLKKKCTRYVKAGTLTRKKTKAGANRVPFTGRLGKRALKPGTYRATLVATAADRRKSKPVRLTFRVVRR